MAQRPTTPDTDWQSLRLWQIQPIRDVLILLAALALVYLGYRLSVVTVPILLALLLAYLFEPLVRRLVSRGWFSRQGAATLIIVSLFLVVFVPLTIGVGFAVLQTVSIVREVSQNVGLLAQAVDGRTDVDRARARELLSGPWRWAADEFIELRQESRAEDPEAPVRPLVGTAPTVSPEPPPRFEPDEGEEAAAAQASRWRRGAYRGADVFLKWLHDNSQSIARTLGQQAIGGGAQAVTAVIGLVLSVGFLGFSLFLTAFFFFFFSTGYGKVLVFWEGLIPERKRGRVFDLLSQMDAVIAGFVRGRLLIAAILGAFLVVAYWFIGVPAPFLVGLGAGFLFLLPYISVLAVPVAIILMALHPGPFAFQQTWWWILLAPIGVYIIGQLLDDYVLSPIIQGKATGLDAPMILFASIAGGALAGVYGLLLAIPVAACLKILANEVFWPRVKDWARGREKDILPIGRG